MNPFQEGVRFPLPALTNFYSMEFIGTIKKILPTRSGVSKTGKEWKAVSFVVENTEGKYPEGYLFETFNDLNANEGEKVVVKFDGRVREWEGKYFNSLNAYKVTRLDEPQPISNEESGLPF